MTDFSQLATKTFGACQGIFMARGDWPPNFNPQAHDHTYIAMQLLLMRKGFHEMSVGLTQLASAMKEMETRLATRR